MEVFKLVFSPIEVNTYVLAGKSGKCIIIDCGCYDEKEFSRLVKAIETRKLQPALLLNTHCHLDHVFGNRMVLEKYGLSSHFSVLEESNRLNGPSHAALFGLDMRVAPEAESFIEHGQVITMDEISLKCFLVPGHTAGSIAFYSEADGCVFTGDALFAGSIGRSDLEGGNHVTLVNAIKSLLLTLPEDTIVYSGHGQATTIGREKKTNPYLV